MRKDRRKQYNEYGKVTAQILQYASEERKD
jgi:hypothetical protein